jgi:hypothetical protein
VVTAVGSLLHEFQIEETNGNEWNVLGHGGHGDMATETSMILGLGGVVWPYQLDVSGVVVVWSDWVAWVVHRISTQ